ncbi:MAG: Iron-dependent repressor IdeR [Opitutia bacterium UBA7350]|nr:MAG: Iron-dependent repressor IdeR [Opitutae bacterium UBA7350]
MNADRMPSATVEDYIKHIYALAEASDNGEASMGRVAEALGVVPGTATTMVKALADAGLAHYSPRVGVQLTPQGRALALHVLRRHRLIEQFLVEVLGFDWAEVHEEAELLEHVISDRLLERIDQRLGHPTEDPHGDPIPNAEGELPKDPLESLADCAAEIPYEVARVSDQEIAFLHYLAETGLNPGSQIVVTSRSTGADAVTFRLGASEKSITMGNSAAAKILVRPRA